MALNSFQETFVAVLRAAEPQGFAWGDTGSPYYEEAPEGVVGDPSAAPYVEFELADTHLLPNTSLAYTETCELTVRVIGVQSSIMALSSPYADFGLFRLLDGYIPEPEVFNGANFGCVDFQRHLWGVHADRDVRAPNGERVWIAMAVYSVVLESEYPPKV